MALASRRARGVPDELLATAAQEVWALDSLSTAIYFAL